MSDPEDYITKSYSALRDNLRGFNKTPEQFRELITKDPAYRTKVYSALRDNIQGFDRTPEAFDSLVIPQKKNGLSVGTDGLLHSTSPLLEDSDLIDVKDEGAKFEKDRLQQASDNNFGLPTPRQLAAGQQSVSENTRSVGVMQTILSDEEKFHHEERIKARQDKAEKIRKATPVAIENAAKKSLKVKGLNPNNTALLNSEKANFEKEVESGNATVGFSKEGEAGLINHPGFFESFHHHMMSAIEDNKNAREFAKMSLDERIKFANKLQEEKLSPYIKERAVGAASVGELIGGVLPTLALYGAGAAAGGVLEAAAPETGGLSHLALKPVMTFVMNAGGGAAHAGMQGTLGRYYAIKTKNPEISDEQAMAKASSTEEVDRLAGIAETALFSKVGGEMKLGKSATVNFIKGMAKSGLFLGRTTAGIEGLRGIGHQIAGDGEEPEKIIEDMATVFGANAPVGAVLHGFMGAITGIAKVPSMIKSAMKRDIVTKYKPEEIQSALEENVHNGSITKEDAELATIELHEFKTALDKIPNGLSPEAEASAAGLIIKRDNIIKSAENKDKTAQDLIKQQTDAIDNQLKEIYRTGKPLEHEINPASGEPFKQPTFDEVQKQRVEDLADKISKGKRIEDAEDLQTEVNFQEELSKQLERLAKKEAPKEDEIQSDAYKNIQKYLKKSQPKTVTPEEITELSIEDSNAPLANEIRGIENINIDKTASNKDVIDYAVGKVAEAPIKMKADLGEDLFNKVLEQTPTEKLQEGLDYLIKNNPDSKDVDVLDKIISDRESAQPKADVPKATVVKNLIDRQHEINVEMRNEREKLIEKYGVDYAEKVKTDPNYENIKSKSDALFAENEKINIELEELQKTGVNNNIEGKKPDVVDKSYDKNLVTPIDNPENVSVNKLKKEAGVLFVTQEKKDAIQESVNKEGVKTPIIVNKDNGDIIDGSHRLAAAQEAGIKNIPVIYVKGLSRKDGTEANKDLVKDVSEKYPTPKPDVVVDKKVETTETKKTKPLDTVPSIENKKIKASDIKSTKKYDDGTLKGSNRHLILPNGKKYLLLDWKGKYYLNLLGEQDKKAEAYDGNKIRNEQSLPELREKLAEYWNNGILNDTPLQQVEVDAKVAEPKVEEKSFHKKVDDVADSLIKEETEKKESSIVVIPPSENKPPNIVERPEPPSKGGEEIGITHADTSELRKEAGLEEYEKTPQTVAQWTAEADKRIANGEMPALLDSIRNEKDIGNVGQIMMGKYIATLNDAVNKNPSNENIQTYKEAIELSDLSGSKWGREGRARQEKFIAENTVGSQLMLEMQTLGVKELSEETKKEVIAETNEINDLTDKVKNAYDKGYADALKKEAEKEASKIKKPKQSSSNRDFVAERQTLKDKLKQQFEEYKASLKKTKIIADSGVEGFVMTAKMAKTIGEIFKNHAEEVALKFDALVNKTFDDIKDVLTGVSKRDIVDVMAGVYTSKQPTRNELAARLRDFKTEAVLLRKLEDERLGKPKTVRERNKKSQRTTELENKIKEIRDRKKDTTPVEKTEGERLADKRKFILKSITEIEADIKAGRFGQHKRLPPVILDAKTQALQDRLIELETQQLNRRQRNEYEKTSELTKMADNAWQVLGLRRFVNAAIDFSILFRQASPVTMNIFKYIPRIEDGRLKMNTAPIAIANMFRLAFDPKGFRRFQYNLEKSEAGRTFTHFNGVFSNPTEVRMEKREEEFANNLIPRLRQKIDESGNVVLIKGADILNQAWFSERAAAGLLNTVRIEEFTKGAKDLVKHGFTPENAAHEYKELVKWVMNITGRGNMLRSIEDSHAARVVANRTYFGARLFAAKVNMLNPVYYARMPKALRVHVLKDVLGNVSTMVVVGLAARALGASISFDPDEPDFLQLRFGDKVIDISGGSVGYVRTFIRMMKAIIWQGANVGKKIAGKDVDFKAANAYSRFAASSAGKTLVANKLSPNTAYVYHLFTGKSAEYDENGKLKPFDPYDIIEIYPLYVDGTVQAYKEGGLAPSLLVLGLDVFGIGVQQYDKKGDKGNGLKLNLGLEKLLKKIKERASSN